MDLSHFQWDERQAGSGSRPKKPITRRRLRNGFIKGPIPLDWMETAASLPGKATHAALAIWFDFGLSRGGEVRFTRRLAERFGLGRKAASVAIANLESAGLIAVKRRSGCAPRITVLSQGDNT